MSSLIFNCMLPPESLTALLLKTSQFRVLILVLSRGIIDGGASRTPVALRTQSCPTTEAEVGLGAALSQGSKECSPRVSSVRT